MVGMLVVLLLLLMGDALLRDHIWRERPGPIALHPVQTRGTALAAARTATQCRVRGAALGCRRAQALAGAPRSHYHVEAMHGVELIGISRSVILSKL